MCLDRQITKRRNDYRDPTSTRALNRLNDSLTEVNSIMQKNIDDILTRGNRDGWKGVLDGYWMGSLGVV